MKLTQWRFEDMIYETILILFLKNSFINIIIITLNY